MKKFAFYLISLLACVGLASSCSSDDDDMDFSDGTELAVGGEEINGITNISSKIRAFPYSSDTCFVRCFHSEEEAVNSKDLEVAGLHKGTTVELPPIDWNRQTLVLARCKDANIGYYANCKIIKKGEKYRIELYSYMTITQDIRSISACIVINKPNIMEEDFSLKSISLGPGEKAFGDPDGYGS